jgi:hypothetical protein
VISNMTDVETVCLDLADTRWQAWTAAQPAATVFHQPTWAGLLQACYGYRPGLLVSLAADGRPVAALPLMHVASWLTGRRVVSLPFSDFCPPLVLDGVSLDDVVAGWHVWRRRNAVSELRVHWPLPDASGVHPVECVFRHVTPLEPDSERVFRSFARKHVQQPIRKAERDGVSVTMSDRWEDARLFYGLHLETRRRLGTPVQPLRFFRLIWERLISQGLGFILLAHARTSEPAPAGQDSQLLAGALFLHFNQTLIYKYSASDPAYWGLRPNNLILWRAIRWGCEHDYRVFDGGRTDPDNTGLREFKLGWGSEEQLLHYSTLADRSPKAAAAQTNNRFLTSLIQRSPAWVCRAIGELFYQHFG